MTEDPDDTQRLVDRFVAQYTEHGVESLLVALVMVTKQGAANPAVVQRQVRKALESGEPRCGNCGSVPLCDC